MIYSFFNVFHSGSSSLSMLSFILPCDTDLSYSSIVIYNMVSLCSI